MGFLRKLFGGSGQPTTDPGYYLYARCDRCGTPVRTRIDMGNELAADYGDTETEGYTLTKEMMDDRCFRVMRATVVFDRKRVETSRTIDGGAFITAAEYSALKEQPPLQA